ncbi:MAG: hypothetical protein K6B70_05180 [Clostridia bacterium]|nr:hypothetical protein [Clostridia bacterium]
MKENEVLIDKCKKQYDEVSERAEKVLRILGKSINDLSLKDLEPMINKEGQKYNDYNSSVY